MPKTPKLSLAVVPLSPEQQEEESLRRAVPQALELSSRRITRKSLPRYQESILLAYSPAQLTTAMTTIWKLAKGGDLQAARTILEMHNLIQTKGGVNVNVLQQNVNGGSNGYDRTFDAITRKLDQQRRAEIIDVEPQ